jgi:hypothetical protein
LKSSELGIGFFEEWEKMITVVRTVTTLPGETGAAIAWAKEVAAIAKRVTGKEQIIATSFAGMLADIAWIGQYNSVGQYDGLRTCAASAVVRQS